MAYKRKTGDTRPIKLHLTQKGGFIDLSNATGVTFVARQVEPGSKTITAVLTIFDPPTGYVGFDPRAEDVADAGVFRCEFHVQWADGSTKIIPGDEYEAMELLPSLA